MTDFAKLVLDADTKGLKNAERDLDGLTGSASSAARKVGASMAKLGAGLTAGVTAPLGFFAKGAVQAAIDAQEMESAFDVVFGNMSDDVRAWAEVTGNALGRSTQEVQRGALAFQELFGKALDPAQAADMSKQFAVLTQDLASFKNLSNEVAQQKLFSGLTGEAEPLRAVGVFINEAAVQAKALELGLTGVNGKLTDQEKIVARAALIQEQLANAQGDVLRTADSTANQIKASQAAFEELQVVIGTKLIPVITPLITKLGAAFEWFSTLPSAVQDTVLVFAGVAAAAGPLLLIMGSIVTIAPAIAAGFAAISAPLLPLAAVVGGIAAAGYLLYQNWDKIAPVLENVRARFEEVLGPKIQAAIDKIGSALTTLWEGPFGEAIQTVMSLMFEFQAAYGSVFGEVLIRAIGVVVETFSGFISIVSDGLALVSQLLTGDFSGAWESAKRIIGTFADTVLGVLDSLIPGIRSTIEGVQSAMIQMGRDMIAGLVNGIKANASAVWDAMMNVAMGGVNRVKEFLGIQSPSRLFMEIGGFVSEGLAIGIQNGQGLVDTAVDELGAGLVKLKDQTDTVTDGITRSFESMATNTLSALDRLAGSIKGGGFLDILSGVIGFGTQLGGLGLFGEGIQKNLNTPSFAGGGYTGSGSRSGGTDGQGGFLATLHPNETVVDHSKGQSMGGGQTIVINNSSFADVYVDGKIQQAAPAIAQGGAVMANEKASRMQRRVVR